MGKICISLYTEAQYVWIYCVRNASLLLILKTLEQQLFVEIPASGVLISVYRIRDRESVKGRLPRVKCL